MVELKPVVALLISVSLMLGGVETVQAQGLTLGAAAAVETACSGHKPRCWTDGCRNNTRRLSG